MSPVLQLTSRSGSFCFLTSPLDAVHPFRTDTAYVVHTSIDETRRATQAATRFAAPLGLSVTLLDFRIVPYAQPIDVPSGISPIATAAFGEELERDGVTASRRVVVCRELPAAIATVLASRSLVFIGIGRRWFGTSRVARQIRHALEAAGHLVVVVDRSPVEETAHA